MLKTNSNFFEKFENYDFKLWQKSLNENLSSTFIVTKSVAKHMIKRKKGSIINIASDVGIISPDHRIYEANKKINYKGVNFNTPHFLLSRKIRNHFYDKISSYLLGKKRD